MPCDDGETDFVYIAKKIAAIATGPYAACDNIWWLNVGDKVYIHCQTLNDYGNLWYYVRAAGTQKYGWAYSGDTKAPVYEDENGNGVITILTCGYL